jgi:hypothetical protein
MKTTCFIAGSNYHEGASDLMIKDKSGQGATPSKMPSAAIRRNGRE